MKSPGRTRAARGLRLRCGRFGAVLNPRHPGTLRLSWGGSTLAGGVLGSAPLIRVHVPGRGNDDSASAGLVCRVRAHRSREGAAWEVHLEAEGRVVISFSLYARMDTEGLVLGLEEVRETGAYQLVHVDLPDLLCAHTADPDSRLALTAMGGRRVDPARCADGRRVHRYNWMRDAYCTVGAVYTRGVCGLVVLESLNDYLLSSVGPAAGGRAACLGARMVHRMEATESALQFVAHRGSRVRIQVLGGEGRDVTTGWVPAARWVHARLRPQTPDPYAGRFVYKVFVGRPGTPAEVPFDEVLRRIRRWHGLLGGAAQICYLVGFQHEGHDSGYPDVFTVNQAAGGAEALARLIREARELNTVVSFHDNYDDAYACSPAWDEEDIGRDGRGDLLRGGVWNGRQAYWISLPSYVGAKASDRIRRTLGMYDIRETYHLDVLTASVFRPDFNPREPRDKNDDHASRIRLVSMFRERGIDVTSEGAGLPFLEAIRYFWEFPRPPEALYEGDEVIPFATFMAHGVASYGGSLADRHGVAEGLLQGSFYAKDIGPATEDQEILEAYYLLFLPLDLLRAEGMVDYAEEGARRVVTYADGSRVAVDLARAGHEVVYRGVTVLRDWVCMAPTGRAGFWMLYISPMSEMGLAARRRWWPCPPPLSGAGLRATELTPSGDGATMDLPVTAEGIDLASISTGVPYRVECVARRTGGGGL